MVRSIVFLVACMLSAIMSTSQTLPDSVQHLFREKTGTDLYYALHGVAADYANNQDPRALMVSELAEKQAADVGDSLCIIMSQRLKGQILLRFDRLQEAVDVLHAVSDYSGDDGERLNISNALGIGYLYLGKFDLALEQYTKVEQLSRKMGDSVYIARGLHNVGITYYKLKDFRKALRFLLESYEIKMKTRDLHSSSLMNISLCYSALNDYRNARKFLKESVALCAVDCSSIDTLHIEYASGVIFHGEGKIDSAEISFRRSLDRATAVNDTRMQLDNTYLLSQILIDKNDFRSAEILLRNAESVIADNSPFNLEKIKVYSRLVDLYSTVGDFERVSDYQAKYITLKDSIYDETVTTNLMKVESEYLQRVNLERLADQEEIIALKEKVIAHQQSLNILLAIVGITVFLFAVFLYKNYILKRDLNLVLQRKVQERTRQLESNQYALEKTVKEKDLMIARFQGLFSEVSCTIEGLCSAAVHGTIDPSVRTHLRSVQRTLTSFRNRYGALSSYMSQAPSN